MNLKGLNISNPLQIVIDPFWFFQKNNYEGRKLFKPVVVGLDLVSSRSGQQGRMVVCAAVVSATEALLIL